MGDVDWVFPLCGGVTVTHRCKDAVCIPEAPHDIIGAGLLEAEGFCDWRGTLLDGHQVYLENHRFLLMPHCAPGQTHHNLDDKANGVMFVGGSQGLDRVKRKQVVDWRGRLVDVEPRPLSKKAHWSKSVFANRTSFVGTGSPARRSTSRA